MMLFFRVFVGLLAMAETACASCMLDNTNLDEKILVETWQESPTPKGEKKAYLVSLTAPIDINGARLSKIEFQIKSKSGPYTLISPLEIRTKNNLAESWVYLSEDIIDTSFVSAVYEYDDLPCPKFNIYKKLDYNARVPTDIDKKIK